MIFFPPRIIRIETRAPGSERKANPFGKIKSFLDQLHPAVIMAELCVSGNLDRSSAGDYGIAVLSVCDLCHCEVVVSNDLDAVLEVCVGAEQELERDRERLLVSLFPELVLRSQ